MHSLKHLSDILSLAAVEQSTWAERMEEIKLSGVPMNAGPTLYYLDPTSPFGKDNWLQGAYEQLEDTPGLVFNMVDAVEPDRMEGRNTYFKLDIGDSLGQSQVVSNGGNLPNAVDSEWAEGKLALYRSAHAVELTMDEWELMQNDTAAAVPIVAHKMGKATTKMTRELARMTHMDGSAKLARCGVTTASTTVVLQTTASNQYDRDRLNWLAARRVLIDIVDGTTGAALATDRLVTSVASNGASIVISGAAVTTTTNHVITWANSVADFSSGTYTSGEFAGLGQLLKTSRTWLGINSATAGNDYWDPVYLQGSSPGTPEAITLGRLQQLYIRMSRRAHDGGQPAPGSGHILFSSYGVAASAIGQLVGQIRYLGPNETPDFGFTEITGLGLRWLTDVHYANNVLDVLRIGGEYGINFVRPKNPMQGILDFITTGSGDMWHLKTGTVAGTYATAMQSWLTGLWGMACKKPSECGRLDDCTAVAG